MADRKNRIKVLAAERNLSVAELAKISGVQPHNLRRYARQEAQPRLEMAQKIAAALQVSLDDVMGTSLGKPQTAAPASTPAGRIPVFGAAQGGVGFDITDVSAPVDYIIAPDYLAGSSSAYAVLVTGDSMEPRFYAGETLFVHPGLPVRSGDDVVIQMKAQEETHAVVKRFVRRSNGDLICEQFNPAVEVRFKADNAIAVHKVVGTKIAG